MTGFHELHASVWGRSTNHRVLLCLHGYSGNGRDFDFLAAALAPELRVVCPDTAGRGRSGRLPASQYHFPQFLADLRILISRLGVDGVDIVGTSMGGLLGMLLAAQPGSPVRRLVMNDVGAYLPPDALRAIGRNLAGPVRFDSLAGVEAHMRRTHAEWGDLTPAQWRHLAQHGSRRERGGYRLHYDPAIAAVVQPVPLSPGLHFWDAWYRVRCPVMLLRGERSAVFPEYVARTMLDIKPSASLVQIEGAGHAPALMSPAEIALVADFLGAAGPAEERRSMRAVFAGSDHGQVRRLFPPRAA